MVVDYCSAIYTQHVILIMSPFVASEESQEYREGAQ